MKIGKAWHLFGALVLIYSGTSSSSEIAFGADDKLCQIIQTTILGSIKPCYQSIQGCVHSGLEKQNVLKRLQVNKLTTNKYGYTQVNTLNLPSTNQTWVNLDNFKGDRQPRVLETWIVPTTEFDRLLDSPPDTSEISKHRNSYKYVSVKPFKAMLQKGTKLSNQFLSPFVYNNRLIFIDNTYQGHWQYGGDFYASKIKRSFVKEIKNNGEIETICEISYFTKDQTGNSKEQNFRVKMENYLETILHSKSGSKRSKAAMWFSSAFTDNGADPNDPLIIDLVIDHKSELINILNDKHVARYIIELIFATHCHFNEEEKKEIGNILSSIRGDETFNSYTRKDAKLNLIRLSQTSQCEP